VSAPAPKTAKEIALHASCVAFGDRAVLICGPSNSGKSSLAIELIALGAALIADDLTRLKRTGDRLTACAPPRLQGVIEARNVGLLRAPFCPQANLQLLVNMDKPEPDRLPHNHVTDLLGVTIETIYKVKAGYFAAAIRLLVTGGRHEA